MTAGTVTDRQGMITTKWARGACIDAGADRKNPPDAKVTPGPVSELAVVQNLNEHSTPSLAASPADSYRGLLIIEHCAHGFPVASAHDSQTRRRNYVRG